MAEVTGLPARIGAPAPGGGPDVPAAAQGEPPAKVLLFQAADEWFGMTLDRVREVFPRGPITRVPRAPAQVLGVMNLRGRAVVVVDLACSLGLPACGAEASHVVLMDLGDPDLAVGVLADRIDQVVEVELRYRAGSFGPEGGGGAEGHELLEIAGRVAMLLDPLRVLALVLPGAAGGVAGEAA